MPHLIRSGTQLVYVFISRKETGDKRSTYFCVFPSSLVLLTSFGEISNKYVWLETRIQSGHIHTPVGRPTRRRAMVSSWLSSLVELGFYYRGAGGRPKGRLTSLGPNPFTTANGLHHRYVKVIHSLF